MSERDQELELRVSELEEWVEQLELKLVELRRSQVADRRVWIAECESQSVDRGSQNVDRPLTTEVEIRSEKSVESEEHDLDPVLDEAVWEAACETATWHRERMESLKGSHYQRAGGALLGLIAESLLRIEKMIRERSRC